MSVNTLTRHFLSWRLTLRRYQANTGRRKCILLLVLIIVGLIIVLIYKPRGHSSPAPPVETPSSPDDGPEEHIIIDRPGTLPLPGFPDGGEGDGGRDWGDDRRVRFRWTRTSDEAWI